MVEFRNISNLLFTLPYTLFLALTYPLVEQLKLTDELNQRRLEAVITLSNVLSASFDESAVVSGPSPFIENVQQKLRKSLIVIRLRF